MAQLRHLTRDDVEQAAALSRGVGWNQTPDDWSRMLDLAPHGVFGAFAACRLVATSSVVVYGEALAWVGMMIVDAAQRGQGLGKRVLDAALSAPSIPPGAVVGLDATDMGAPLYRARGFVAVEPIDRWGGVLRSAPPPAGIVVRAVEPSDVAELAAWDARRTGIRRAALVTHLLGTPRACGWRADRDGELVGYATLRPGRTHHHLGPLLAADACAFDALTAAVAARLAGEAAFADVVRGAATGAAFARAGLRVERSLTRMTRTRPLRVLADPPIWATAGLEWG